MGRFIWGYGQFFLLGGSQSLGTDAYVNNLGYISHYTVRPNFWYTLIHFTGALGWILGLLGQKYLLHRLATGTASHNSWRYHRWLGYFLTSNALIIVTAGIVKASTQKHLNIEYFFYSIAILVYLGISLGLYYRWKGNITAHRFWMITSIQLPAVMSLWTELIIIFLQRYITAWLHGEMIGLWGSMFLMAPLLNYENFYHIMLDS